MNNRQLWIFKEGRSGSTWFCNALSLKLNRTPFHYESHYNLDYSDDGIETFKKNVIKFTDSNVMYATHYIHLLEYSSFLDPNSILIRTTRRNKAEHVMSKLVYQLFPNTPKHYYATEHQNIGKFKYQPVTVLKQDVKKFMLVLKEHDSFWETHAKNFDNYIVAYEDLFKGITIPYLNVDIKFSDNQDSLKKLPYDKKQIFANYDEIVGWCEECKKELGFMEI